MTESIDTADPCPCGSGLGLAVCCAPLIEGRAAASTAEALMRSRYVAFTRHAVDYLLRTLTRAQRPHQDEKALRRWSEAANWIGLEILERTGGQAGDDAGEVEFVAHYRIDGQPRRHHERSRFRRVDGVWLYDGGRDMDAPRPVRRESRVGRNHPCPCGSGLKFKKCCGGRTASP